MQDTKPKTQRRRSAPPDVFFYDWEGLRAFLDVARNSSLSEAAGRVNVRHTTLSRRITALETSIGRQLIRRSPRGIALTGDGKELLAVLERFEEDLNATGRWISRGVRGMARPLSVHMACTEGLAAYWLTQFLTPLRKRNAPVCYNLHTSLAAKPEKGAAFHASLQLHQPASAELCQQIGSIHFTAMASRDYIQEMGEYRAGEHPGDHRWIEYAPFQVLSGSWEAWFQRHKVEAPPFTVTNSLVTTVNAVRDGVGIALLPTYMAITKRDLVPFDAGLRLKFPIWLHTDPSARDTPELHAALGLIRAAIIPETMPWFGETPIVSPDLEEWRKLHARALERLTA